MIDTGPGKLPYILVSGRYIVDEKSAVTPWQDWSRYGVGNACDRAKKCDFFGDEIDHEVLERTT